MVEKPPSVQGMCCRGVNSTYEIRVGRSRSVTGPFVDQNAKPMVAGGGSLLLGSHGDFIGPGQLGLLPSNHVDGVDGKNSGWVASMHYYSRAAEGAPYLRLMRMSILEGWPQLSPIGA